MDSDSQKSPRPRLRFGFSGKKKRSVDAEVASAGTTADDILDSLTRQAATREKVVSDGNIGSVEIALSEDLGDSWDPITAPVVPTRIRKERDFGRFAFALMLLAGLSVLTLYGFLTKAYDPSLVNKLLQYSSVQTIFAQPLQVGIIAASALLAAIWITRRRKSSNLHLQGY